MNEAIITFVTEEQNVGADYNVALPEFLTVTKVVRVEFEGSPEQFMNALAFSNGTMLPGEPEAFNVVNSEQLSA